MWDPLVSEHRWADGRAVAHGTEKNLIVLILEITCGGRLAKSWWAGLLRHLVRAETKFRQPVYRALDTIDCQTAIIARESSRIQLLFFDSGFTTWVVVVIPIPI